MKFNRFAALVLLVVAIPSLAQTNPNLEQGSKLYGSYDESDFDSVNIDTGNLTLHIPLLGYPQRGSLPAGYALVLNTKTFYVLRTCNPTTGVCTGRWQLDPSFGMSIKQIRNPTFKYKYSGSNYDYGAISWDGSYHQMLKHTNGTAESVDGSGVWADSLTPPQTLRVKNGDLIAKDTNGNYFSSPQVPYTDTMGRSFTINFTASDATGCGGPVGQITSSNISTYPGPNGVAAQIKVCSAVVSVQSNFQAHNVDYPLMKIPEYLAHNQTVIQSVVVYNGSSWATSPAWTFEYVDRDSGDSTSINYGNLSKVTLPTGGSISYAYRQFSLCNGPNLITPVSRGVKSRTVDANDGTGPHTTTYTSGSISTDPLGNDTVHTFTGLGGSCSDYETSTKYYQGSSTSGQLLKTVTTDYIYAANPQDGMHDGASTVIKVFPIRITTKLDNNKVSKIEKDYDTLFTTAYGTYSYGNVTEMREYDYGDGVPGGLLRRTVYTYKAFDTASYLTGNILDRVSSVTVYDGSGNQVSKITYGFDEYSLQASGISTQRDTSVPNPGTRGNRTSICYWLNTTGGNICTATKYYDTGMPYQFTDPRGNITTYSYSSTYVGAYLTQTTMPDTNSPNLAHHVISGTYDFNTGKLTGFTDENNQTTQYVYDSLARMTTATFPSPDGGQTIFSYPDLVTIDRKNKIDASRWTDMYVRFDGLGREIRRITANDEATPWDQVDTCYDVLGRKRFVTYPYQGNGLSDAQCVKPGDTFAYDPLGRLTSATHSDSSVVTTSYTGRATSVQDEGNGTRRVQRVSQVDGLGRLTSVCEVSSVSLSVGLSPVPAACGQDIAATGFLTTYAYDTLGNLKTVTQGGLNSRSFNYDSFSRLTSATNPESGLITYKYDSDTNCSSPNSFLTLLVSKTDARGIRICIRYDTLNRTMQKNYSDGTPTATFNFDETSAYGVTLANTIGRPSSQSTASPNPTAEVFSYDQLGRVKTNSQCTPQNCGTSVFSLSYTYDLLGNMLTSTNGTGVALTYAVNRANRMTTLTSSLADANHPGILLQNVHYGAFGPLSDSLGNGMTDTLGYTPRGWLQSISANVGATPRHSFSLTFAPNGNIATGNDSVNGNWSYGYDDFNRLRSANATGQAYTYDYDRYGNRWHQNGPVSSSLGFDANNRITVGSGVTYDTAGDITADASHTYTIDGEGRISKVDNGTTAQYVYDASGQRIRKTTGSTSVDYLYDLAGHQITELSSTGAWNRGEVYTGGRHLATYRNSTTYFIHADWLGTERARTDKSGASFETCTSLAFGDWLTCAGSDISPMHFTGKQRDSESGLDEFGARYYSSSTGRFTIPDWAVTAVPYAEFGNPQSLNLYGYVKNNPTTLVDANGHCPDGLDVCFMPKLAEDKNYMEGQKKGAMVGLGVTAGAGVLAWGRALLTAAVGYFLTPQGQQTAANIAEGVSGAPPGSMGSLTISAATRLSASEISTGVRYAEQSGARLVESSHVGAEFVDAAGKTYDAMGTSAGYASKNFKLGEFFSSVDRHLNKAIDFVIVDLKGASKDQINAITSHIGSLSKEEQARIKIVQ